MTRRYTPPSAELPSDEDQDDDDEEDDDDDADGGSGESDSEADGLSCASEDEGDSDFEGQELGLCKEARVGAKRKQSGGKKRKGGASSSKPVRARVREGASECDGSGVWWGRRGVPMPRDSLPRIYHPTSLVPPTTDARSLWRRRRGARRW